MFQEKGDGRNVEQSDASTRANPKVDTLNHLPVLSRNQNIPPQPWEECQNP